MELMKAFNQARTCAAPLLGVDCFDAAAVIKQIRASEDVKQTPGPLFRWDAQDGLIGLNKIAETILTDLLKTDDKVQQSQLTANAGAALAVINDLPGEVRENGSPTGKIQQRGSIIFALNLHRFFETKADGSNVVVAQGVWNLRDRFKANRRTLVCIGSGFAFPPELRNDFITITVPLPADDELKRIIETRVNDMNLKALEEKVMNEAIDAVRGMQSAFIVEQQVSMSLSGGTLQVDELWERKIATIEATLGLTVDRGTETFDDAGGLDQFKAFGLRLVKSDKAPLLYVRIDEIEKFLGGLGGNGQAGDSTGVSQESLAYLLTEMEDNGWNGIITLGHAGTGKSLITKGLANTASKVTGRRVLSVAMDLGATKDKFVGESGKNLRNLLAVIKAVGGRRVCFVATCNDLDVMPPALRRRFKLGLWMFDLPNREQKDAIWTINLKRFNLAAPATLPDDTDWTPADIRNVCEQADLLGCSLDEACQFVTFVAKNDPESITRLRRKADGKYLDANRPGVYRAERQERVAVNVDANLNGRAVAVKGEEV